MCFFVGRAFFFSNFHTLKVLAYNLSKIVRVKRSVLANDSSNEGRRVAQNEGEWAMKTEIKMRKKVWRKSIQPTPGFQRKIVSSRFSTEGTLISTPAAPLCSTVTQSCFRSRTAAEMGEIEKKCWRGVSSNHPQVPGNLPLFLF